MTWALCESSSLVFGAGNWLPAAIAVVALLIALLAWGYRGSGVRPGARTLAVALKLLGIVILAICLLEPLLSGARARPGANAMIVLADNSQSMTLRDRNGGEGRSAVRTLTAKSAPWLVKLRSDFEVRPYAFDAQLRALADGEPLPLDGRASNLGAALERLLKRQPGRPVAGVVLLTDGTATDVAAVERLIAQQAAAAGAMKFPPIYPVLLGGAPADDVSVGPVAVTQTNFEDAPVTLAADVCAAGYAGRAIVVQLLDETGKVCESQTVMVDGGKPAPVRFRVRPDKAGVSFYRVRAAAGDELGALDAPDTTREATPANNTRLVTVDRGQGPYRVMYVAGRPNWEFKFLRRSVESDHQVQMVGLFRVAKREPKFNFLSRSGESSNPLFRGFKDGTTEPVEQYDQPVLVRVGTKDESELRGGFPKTAEELDQYHAIVLDDVEAEFFTQDQLGLIKDFVRQRGGGLLMLGGAESFHNAKFDRTPLGDLMPVYADGPVEEKPGGRYRLSLTREGWLEPWVRLRPQEDAERQRIDSMPEFLTLNPVRGIKPGATVLARATAENGTPVPALVEQRFGHGRVAALLIGDLWRWQLKRPADAPGDLEKAWRQTIRWLVAEVPPRVEVTTSPRPGADDAEGSVGIAVRVRDAAYAPLDNAAVSVDVVGPDGKSVKIPADAGERESGRYDATYVPRQPGGYHIQVTAAAPDGSDVGQTRAGWAADPAVEEFADLKPNRDLLQRLAAATGGQVFEAADVDKLAAGLPTRHAEITEPYVVPLWHTPWMFLLAIACLAAEWGLRRKNGLP